MVHNIFYQISVYTVIFRNLLSIIIISIKITSMAINKFPGVVMGGPVVLHHIGLWSTIVNIDTRIVIIKLIENVFYDDVIR